MRRRLLADLATHLITSGATLNSRKRRLFRCHEFRPCKRMTCHQCVERRRDYFIAAGTEIARAHGLNTHVILSWPLETRGECYWSKLATVTQALGTLTTGRLGKYVRVAAIGDRKSNPHLHFLVTQSVGVFLKIKAKQIDPRNLTEIDTTYDVEGLLGYFFDRNFLPTYRRTDRPKRIRLISGARGMSYGYPSQVHWKALRKLRSRKGLIVVKDPCCLGGV